MSSHAHTDSHAHHGPHVTSVQTYVTVFLALLLFTGLTFGVSYADLGPFSLPVAMLVAFCKATLVATYFMHLKYDERFNLAIFVSSLFFVAVFAFFVLVDLASRDLIVPEEGHHFMRQEAEIAAEARAAAEAAAAAPAAEAAPAADAAPAAEAAPAAAVPAAGSGGTAH